MGELCSKVFPLFIFIRKSVVEKEEEEEKHQKNIQKWNEWSCWCHLYCLFDCLQNGNWQTVVKLDVTFMLYYIIFLWFIYWLLSCLFHCFLLRKIQYNIVSTITKLLLLRLLQVKRLNTKISFVYFVFMLISHEVFMNCNKLKCSLSWFGKIYVMLKMKIHNTLHLKQQSAAGAYYILYNVIARKKQHVVAFKRASLVHK